MSLALFIGMVVACGDSRDLPTLPPSPGPKAVRPDPGYTIVRRPPCDEAVVDALKIGTPQAVADAAARGAVFTCGYVDDPLPLDDAVMANDLPMVRALLEAKADPNARWTFHGDRFPLQEAVELRQLGLSVVHRTEMIHLLLEHGANPNQRWCPFESRGSAGEQGCVSERGMTALHWAAYTGDAGLAFALLSAGADADIEDRYGSTPVHIATSEAVLYQLLARLGPQVTGRGVEVLDYLARRAPPLFDQPGPWDETALSQAISGRRGNGWLPPPPPPPPGSGPRRPYSYDAPGWTGTHGRVRALLDLGADPSQRLSWGGVDWPPLALGIAYGDAEVVTELLARRVDVNARWCVPIVLRAVAPRRPEPGCTLSTGFTPVILAAELGRPNVVRAVLGFRPDVAARDFRGLTALERAQTVGHKEVVEILSAYIDDRRQVVRQR